MGDPSIGGKILVGLMRSKAVQAALDHLGGMLFPRLLGKWKSRAIAEKLADRLASLDTRDVPSARKVKEARIASSDKSGLPLKYYRSTYKIYLQLKEQAEVALARVTGNVKYDILLLLEFELERSRCMRDDGPEDPEPPTTPTPTSNGRKHLDVAFSRYRVDPTQGSALRSLIERLEARDFDPMLKYSGYLIGPILLSTLTTVRYLVHVPIPVVHHGMVLSDSYLLLLTFVLLAEVYYLFRIIQIDQHMSWFKQATLESAVRVLINANISKATGTYAAEQRLAGFTGDPQVRVESSASRLLLTLLWSHWDRQETRRAIYVLPNTPWARLISRYESRCIPIERLAELLEEAHPVKVPMKDNELAKNDEGEGGGNGV